jgi:DNA-binding transcriptional ArsR family regulator
VRDEERSVNELVLDLSMSQPAVSKHLRVLRDSGFVRSRVDGQRRMYSVDPQAFVEVEDWLEPYRRLWEDRLDSLQRYLEAVQKDEEKPAGDGETGR